MTQTAINWNELVAETTALVRKGASLTAAINEIASDWDANPAVLAVRFNKAWPDGVPGALPSPEEMEARRRAAIREHNAQVEAEAQAINEFFDANPALYVETRRNIYKVTGRKSCSLRTAKRIADSLAAGK